MALIKCPECSKQVSDQAKSCPSCGCPISAASHTGEMQAGESNYVKATIGFWDVSYTGFKIKENIVCPHCKKHGCVATKRHKAKKGVSGGKATGALLTGGLSLLATGLSREEWVMDAKCKNCGAEWRL